MNHLNESDHLDGDDRLTDKQHLSLFCLVGVLLVINCVFHLLFPKSVVKCGICNSFARVRSNKAQYQMNPSYFECLSPFKILL